MPPSLHEARDYCRRMAAAHYENFTVASWFLPRPLRQHFCNVYAYCRAADDLADETGDPRESLKQLDAWERRLDAMYAGEADHPIFVALRETVARFHIPPEPFRNLLVAFRQDQTKHRYATFNELLGYCRHSANPVGHLVLYLGESFNEENARLADNVCTGLQLANFWQDVARDYKIGRVYLPQETLERFGASEAQLAEARESNAFRDALAHEVARADEFLLAGKPLVGRVRGSIRLPVRLFLGGGREVLAAIRRRGYNVLRERPRVGRMQKLKILIRAWLGM